jgi:two-component system LytT family response regulator
VFLDIRMPGLDGLEVAEVLSDSEEPPPAVVFVTAFADFAVEAFDVSAVDYLLKPVERERFDRALERAEGRLKSADGAALTPEVRRALETIQGVKAYASRFFIRSARGHYFVAASGVEWVDAQGNYARLHADGRAHLVRRTMKALEASLDPRRFVRVHRSAIVAVDAVVRIEPQGHAEYQLTLRDGTRLVSSRTYGSRIRELMGNASR